MVDSVTFLDRASRSLPEVASYALRERQISPTTDKDSAYTFYAVAHDQCVIIAHWQGARQLRFARPWRVSPSLSELDNPRLPLEAFEQIVHEHAHLGRHEAA